MNSEKAGKYRYSDFFTSLPFGIGEFVAQLHDLRIRSKRGGERKTDRWGQVVVQMNGTGFEERAGIRVSEAIRSQTSAISMSERSLMDFQMMVRLLPSAMIPEMSLLISAIYHLRRLSMEYWRMMETRSRSASICMLGTVLGMDSI